MWKKFRHLESSRLAAGAIPRTRLHTFGRLPSTLGMSSKKFSPAAKLLRHSRLMAMPAPIPSPATFTINTPPPSPHPTLQAITASRSSANRGDWGLKRNLPVKTSKKVEYLRYEDLDTIEHMTTFESAHDDVYTLKKWQEIDLAISKHENLDIDILTHTGVEIKTTVFDHDTKPEGYKWRHKGPYLQQSTDGEVREYIEKSVLPRKAQFYDFVSRRMQLEELRKKYVAEEIPFTREQLEKEFKELPRKDIDILALRANPLLLDQMVREFLDLPTYESHRTHPSAGLHYTRSSAHAYNDPVHGPQEQRKIVQGRPMNFSSSGLLAGIGGVVAKVLKTFDRRGAKNDDRFAIYEYRPLRAVMNAQGKILMEAEQVTIDGDIRGAGNAWRGILNATAEKTGRASSRGKGQPDGRDPTDEILSMLSSFKDLRTKGSTSRSNLYNSRPL